LNTDNIEINKFIKGDIKNFESIFKAYYKALVVYANTILNDIEEAEDRVQQVYIMLWEKRATIEIHTSLRSFLYKAVHNACLNKIKQQNIKTEYAKVIQLSSTVEYKNAILEEKELQKKIEDAIDILPEQCGKIFKMSRFEELKYKEIADTLGLSVKTIENQMGKALKILREQLKEYLPLIIIGLIKIIS
jgi:RNA polymerase sigma-70 factor, ECF subfamily